MQEPLLYPDAAAQILQQVDDKNNNNIKALSHSEILHHKVHGSTWENSFRPS